MKKIETLAEYQQLASRTCPDLGSKRLNIFHMNTGIVTEIGEAIDPIKKKIAYGKELDLINIGEEIADTIWYIANRATIFLGLEVAQNIWNTSVFVETIDEYNRSFHKELSDIKNEEDKLIFVTDLFYTVKPQASLHEIDIMSCVGLPCVVLLYKACELLGLDFWQLLTNNIAKLQIRYPDKFSNENALNRDLEAERTELEK